MNIDSFYIRHSHMKCNLYITMIALFLTSYLQAMEKAKSPDLHDQTEFPSLKTAYSPQYAALAGQKSDMSVFVKALQPKKLQAQPISKTPPAVTVFPSEDEMFDEDDQTPYTLKDDKQRQYYLNYCYHGS